MNTATALRSRTVYQVQSSTPVTDGDGVRIQRNVASGGLENYDPFLLLDEIASDEAADYIGGFPEHPHRGFETVTYMLEGSMKHRDHMGNEGLLEKGSVQWMTAGRGVLHSEMPQQESGLLHGFQLWINLPAKEKMCEPQYREFAPTAIPQLQLGEHSSIKLIAGRYEGPEGTRTGAIIGVSTQPDFFDVILAQGESVRLPTAMGKRVLVYVYKGAITLPGNSSLQTVAQQQLAMLNDGDEVAISAKEDSRFLFLAAMPIGEPISNWGPFVMNTREEIEQAIQDYRNGTLV